MNEQGKVAQLLTKSRPVSVTAASSMTLTCSITITSEEEQQDVDAFLVNRCKSISNIGFQTDISPEDRSNLINEYRRALRHHPKWVLAQAIDMSVRSCAHKPTPGNINSAANSVINDIVREIGRKKRGAEASKALQVKREPVDKESANQICLKAGFTPERTEKFKQRPLICNYAELDASSKDISASRHWSDTEALDSPKIVALHKTRSENKLISEARVSESRSTE